MFAALLAATEAANSIWLSRALPSDRCHNGAHAEVHFSSGIAIRLPEETGSIPAGYGECSSLHYI
jgi:hypothetical protein